MKSVSVFELSHPQVKTYNGGANEVKPVSPPLFGDIILLSQVTSLTFNLEYWGVS